jgi:hypothetical protein
MQSILFTNGVLLIYFYVRVGNWFDYPYDFLKKKTLLLKRYTSIRWLWDDLLNNNIIIQNKKNWAKIKRISICWTYRLLIVQKENSHIQQTLVKFIYVFTHSHTYFTLSVIFFFVRVCEIVPTLIPLFKIHPAQAFIINSGQHFDNQSDENL